MGGGAAGIGRERRQEKHRVIRMNARRQRGLVPVGGTTRAGPGINAAPFVFGARGDHLVAVSLQLTDGGQPERVFYPENQ